MLPRTHSPVKIPHNPMEIFVVRSLMLLLYLTVFLVAVTGNFLVVYVVMTNKRMQTVTNIFITNLAISDLLVNFTSLWLTPMYTYVGHWIWGGGLCHGLPLFQGTSIFISTMTLTAIAIDRYLVIVHNSSNVNINDRMSMRTCIMIITLIWTVSLLLVLPYAINMKLTYIGQPCDFVVCTEDWSSQRFRTIFGIIVMSLQFVIPFVLIGISYSCIWIFLNNRSFASERRGEAARKKRLLRMLIVMVVIFAVCWFPFNLLNILRDLKWDSFMKPYFSFLFLLVHLITMTATCWNPILYAWMNESFREEFARAIPFLRSPNSAPSRVRIITDCKPATERTNCADCSTVTNEAISTVYSKSVFSRISDGFLGNGISKLAHREKKRNTLVVEDSEPEAHLL
ncbi:unnamed protein product [Caenorhabditis auriculariae]|uniref:G-protein coupled receptors family 1 profile domain-containing protein n=1 Tax=Caenorhabditis auriculariae TaxID=2777116 RepID=A0A8S1GQ48_9PELO|nr:unnamed protein product [Caenorhabditis auriculariae]